MKIQRTILAALLATCGVATAQAPSESPAAPPKPRPAPPCVAAEYRQFDFWIGDWDVFTTDGKLAGTNRIEAVLNGCVLHEHWLGGKLAGESFNAWDGRRKQWHQTWVDAAGNVLLLDGRFDGNAMTLSDAGMPGGTSGRPINEIIWTPNADGSVRQHWRTSTDGGKTWKSLFDGRYVRAARPQPAAPAPAGRN